MRLSRSEVTAALGRLPRLDDTAAAGSRAAAVAITLVTDEVGGTAFLLTRRSANLS